ncbi:MAG: hypothetical protein KBD15_01960 [Candidatus Magasanikbacteria bacterium]|nr:hypothetical protein [Candidatus Magasanikbacteria bacterium]
MMLPNKTQLTRSILFLSTLCAVLFVSGCGTKTQTTDTSPSSTPQIIDDSVVIETTPDQQAYILCTQTGNDIRIRFDSSRNKRVIECVFDNGSTCLASDLLAETCEKGIPIESYPALSLSGNHLDPTVPRFCDSVAAPVCGTNGNTYTNRCIAESLRVSVQAEGSCPNIEPDSNVLGIPNGNAVTVVNNGQPISSGGGGAQPTSISNDVFTGGQQAPVLPNTPQQPANPNALPSWLNASLSLLDTDPTNSQAFVERCTIAGTQYYLQVERCPRCFSMLYTSAGSIQCYPHNDITSSCPRGFSYGSRGAQCTVIWKNS